MNTLTIKGKAATVYAEVVDGKAMAQFAGAMACDFAVKGALMPDVHAGYALPIGAVVATEGVVVPAWVGYDIGCGMCAVPMTGVDAEEVRLFARSIFERIYERVPVGFRHNDRPQPPFAGSEKLERTRVVQDQLDDGAWRQLGTLGGGNHFIEVAADAEGQVWIVIHSGSRNLGHKTATHYMRLASGDGKAREGHFGFLADTSEGKAYLADLRFCLEFALANRREMVRRVADAIASLAGGEPDWDRLINRNHNHAERHDGTGWLIHRKGATHAEAGMMGVIPGTMRDGSFIVRGKGNPDSLWSSSHGAGRVLSRKEARESISLEDFDAAMAGIVARVGQGTVDEAPQAYKDIHEVMRQQVDLVEVVHHLRPIINVKG